MNQNGHPDNASVGALFHQLLDDGRAYARAEVDVVRETAKARISYAKLAIILGVGAIFVAQAGLTVLFIALGMAIALVVPPWAGYLIAALIALAIAGLMVKYAASHLTPPAETSASRVGVRS